MDLGLTGKCALITGSTAGIGYATAERLAREGARVVINGRTSARVAAAVRSIQALVPTAEVSGIAADVSTAAGCAQVITEQGQVDVLVNNMGVFEPKPFERIPDEDWLHFFEANVLSGIRLSRHYVVGMRARNWGRVVFVSSESALQIPTEMIHYGMTKTAQLAVARGLAESLSGTNVTVNSVLPGPTSSEGVGNFVAELARSRNVDVAAVERDFFRNARPSSVIQRFARPEEIANMIAYVCSEAASATTGASLRVEGGVLRSIA
jgi:NAD(P)-dependent dehydrogenase (short-subunit alcohol dehydrogenase family)